MPTSPVQTYELQGNVVYPIYGGPSNDTPLDHVSLAASTTYAAGTLLGEVTATPGTYGTYAHGHSDGTQKPSHILMYACTTDASGNITVPGQWGITTKSIEAYVAGTFRSQDLPNLDGTNIADWPGAHFTEGTAAQGIVRFP
jgi:hypothetical protein